MIIQIDKLKVEFRFDVTFTEPGLGWNTIRMTPCVLLKKKVIFTGTEVDCTGCSYARANANRIMFKQCMDFITNEYIL